MRKVFFLSLSVCGLLMVQFCRPIDETFGGYTDQTIARLLSADTTKTWELVSRKIDGTENMLDSCEQDDILIFKELGDTDSVMIWSRDSVYCDTIIQDFGWTWFVLAPSGEKQITTDSVFLETDTTSSLRKILDITPVSFSWRYYEVDTLGDSTEFVEIYSVSEFTLPTGDPDEGG